MIRILYVLLCLSMFLAGCKEEPVYQADQITGRWEVHAATRNGKPTTLLNRAIFLFQENGSLMTDFTGQRDTGNFTVANNVIVFQGKEEMSFRIEGMRGDTLELHTELQRMVFELEMHRKITEAD